MNKPFYLLLLILLSSACGCSHKSEPSPATPAFVPPPPIINVGMSANGVGTSRLTNTRVVSFTLGNRAAPLDLDSLILYGELGGQKLLIKYHFPTLQQVTNGSTPLGKVILSRLGVVVMSTGILGGSATNKMSDNPTPNTASGVFDATLTDGTRVYGNFKEAWTKK